MYATIVSMKINLHIADAQGVFSDNEHKKIQSGVRRAEEYTVSKLAISENVDLIITPELPDFLIPEDCLGGRTYTGNFILISLAAGHVDEDFVYEVVCHELCHASRWQKNEEEMKNLFDGMILEGLAVYFEEQAMKNQKNKQFFLRAMLERDDQENAEILECLRGNLNEKYYDYYSIFILGDKEKNIPRWSGYSVGYYLVKKYLEKTGKTIEEAFAEPFDNFRIVIE